MFKKLKYRFTMLNMTIISIVMLCAFTVIYMITYSSIQSQNKFKLDSISTNVLKYIDNYTTNNSFVIVDTSEYIHSFSILIDKDDNPIFDKLYGNVTKEFLAEAIDLALLEDDDSDKIILDKDIYQFSITPVFVQIDSTSSDRMQEESLRQITFLNITDSQKMLNQLLITFIVVAIFMLFIIFAISMYFAKCSVDPIEETYMKQKQFIQDASHELKTPIAAINANLDVIKSNVDETVDSQQKWLGYINYETTRMNKLINDLLYLAKTDNIQVYTEFKPLNLSDIINNSILSMETIAYEKGLQLTQSIESDITISGDKDKTEQIIKILIDNAIKYVNDYGYIEITLQQRKNKAILSISNTGEGISEKHIEKIFDRFYRVDTSRKHSGSYGLGLSIAKALVKNIGADISVISIPNEKTTFTVKFNINV